MRPQAVRAATLALLLLAPSPATARAQADYLAPWQLHSLWAIRDAGRRWGVASSYLACLAWHESGMTPWAVGAEGEIGILQIKPATFYAWAPNSLDVAKGEWNSWSNADVAAFAISRGQSHAWSTTQYCGYWFTKYGY